MPKFLVKKTKNKIESIRLKKAFDLRNSYIRTILSVHKKKGYKLITAKGHYQAQKKLAPKGWKLIHK